MTFGFKSLITLSAAALVGLSACGGGGGSAGSSTQRYDIALRSDKTSLPLNVTGSGPTKAGFNPTYTATLYISATSGGQPVAGASGTGGQFACNISSGLNVGSLYYTDVESGHADADGNPQAFQSITIAPNSGGAQVYFYAGRQAGTATVTCTITEPSSGLVRSASTTITVGADTSSVSGRPANITVSAQAPGSLGVQGNLNNVATSVVLQAYVTDGANQPVPNPTAKNVQVSIVPSTGTAWAGARLVSGTAGGTSLQVPTVGGVAQFTLMSGQSTGVILLSLVSDHADNDVTNGVQDAVARYMAVQVVSAVASADLIFPAASVPVVARQQVVFPLQATGGVGPYTWTAQAGTLPAGLTLDSTSGLLTGTTTVAAGTYVVPVTVTDRNGASVTSNVTLTVTESTVAPVTVSNASITAPLGQSVGFALAASGGTAPYTFAALSPLPAGLSLSASGVISGTPTGSAGTFVVPVRVTDSGAGAAQQTATVNVTIVVTDTTAPLALGETAVTAAVNRPVGFAFTATGGVAPYTFAALGPLPAGLTLSSAGVLSGSTTAAAGSYSVPIRVTDSSGRTLTANATITVTAAQTTPIQVSNLTLNLPVGQSTGVALNVTGGTAPYRFAAETPLPTGLTLNAQTGVISGTPTAAAGTYSVAIRITDASGTVAIANVVITLTATTQGALTVSNGSVTGVVAQPMSSYTLLGAGGTGPYTFTAASPLPQGLQLASNGVLTGTPQGPAGTTTVAVVVRDANGAQSTVNISIVIADQTRLMLTNPTVPATRGQLMSFQLNASGGTAPYTFALAAGGSSGFGLPDGLTLQSTGLIVGTPTSAGVYTVAVTVRDSGVGSAQQTVTQNVTITVSAPTATTP